MKKKQYPTSIFTRLKNQVDNSISNSNSNIHLTKKYSRHNDEDIDTDSKNAKIIDNTSIKKVSRDIDVHQEIDKQPIVRGDNVIDLFNNLKYSMLKMTNEFSTNTCEKKHSSKVSIGLNK